MRSVICGLLLCVGVSFIGEAGALEYSNFTTDEGLRVVAVSGDFESREALDPFASAVAAHNPTVITFNSGGGSVDTAMRLGRMIRSFGLNTIQPRSMECASACALAFLGGVKRGAMSGSIGVHRSAFAEDMDINAADAVVAIQAMTAKVMSYISEMGADPALMEVALQYDRTDMRYLSTSEMERYRIISGNEAPAQPTAGAAPAPPPVPSPPAANAPSYSARSAVPDLSVPVARSGRVRHPKGSVHLRSGPGENATNLATFRNRTPVKIIDSYGRWYRVQTSAGIGFMHDTWVLVDQFESGGFEDRHIQVKSFDSYYDAAAYVRSSRLPLTAYLSTNGWFAITLTDTFDAGMGAELLKQLKAKSLVPDDAYMSYGNTYTRKVCCN